MNLKRMFKFEKNVFHILKELPRIILILLLKLQQFS